MWYRDTMVENVISYEYILDISKGQGKKISPVGESTSISFIYP